MGWGRAKFGVDYIRRFVGFTVRHVCVGSSAVAAIRYRKLGAFEIEDDEVVVIADDTIGSSRFRK